MADDEKRILEMDHYEHGVVLNALNEYRNDVLAEGRTTDLIDEVLEREHMPFRMQPAFLAYYACSRTFFYLREYLFAAMAEDGERTEAQLQEFFNSFVRKCGDRAEIIAAQIRGDDR